MPQFLIPPGKEPGERIRLSSREAHHLRDVLRISVGEKIPLFDGQGTGYLGQIQSLSRQEATVILLSKQSEKRTEGSLCIAQALLKREKMEWVIQKCGELGVQSIQPFCSARTIARLKNETKLDRWRKIAEEASKQSGRKLGMAVATPTSFDKLLKSNEADLRLIFWEGGGKSLKELRLTKKILVVVGPEGGFSDEEIEAARAENFVVLSMGPRILRAETAALVAASLIQYELGNI